MTNDKDHRPNTPAEPANDRAISYSRQKSGAQVYVADGAGGMRPVADLRFEEGEWPIDLVIPAADAETWMAHLDAEIEDRGWNSSAFSQLDAAENSGTISVHAAAGPSSPTLDIVWERLRDASLQLRARPSGDPPMSLDIGGALIDAVLERQRSGNTVRGHRRALLAYDGLPWRGELWLDSDHRIGPPSKHPDALLGPQVFIVDAMIEGIGQKGVSSNFLRRVHELRIFLGFILGLDAKPSTLGYSWVSDLDDQGRITDCTLKLVGYAEVSQTSAFPEVGDGPPIERRDVSRPGLGPMGIGADMHEQWVPADIEPLWNAFTQLSRSNRDHLMRAGNAYLTARAMWPDQRTAYATFLVVACEALKPIGRRYDRMNVYDVISTLVSPSEAARLRKLSLHPQRIRSKHLHRGELAAGELGPMLLQDYFIDPSFDEMLSELSLITRVCLIEWLRREMAP